MDNCSRAEIEGWRSYVKDRFLTSTFFDPVEVEDVYAKDFSQAIETEKSHINECDIFFCYPWMPSTGTSMELMYAHTLGKTIVVVSYPGDYLSGWLRYHATYVAASFNDAFEWIEARNLEK